MLNVMFRFWLLAVSKSLPLNEPKGGSPRPVPWARSERGVKAIASKSATFLMSVRRLRNREIAVAQSSVGRNRLHGNGCPHSATHRFLDLVRVQSACNQPV